MITLTKSGEEQNYEAVRYVVFPADGYGFSLRSIGCRLEGLKETESNLILENQFADRDSNSVPPKYVSRMMGDFVITEQIVPFARYQIYA